MRIALPVRRDWWGRNAKTPSVRSDVGPVVFLCRGAVADPAALSKAAAIAGVQGSRLEVLAWISPCETALLTIGRAFVTLPGPSDAELEREMNEKLARLVAIVPPDVPVRYRVVRRSRRRILRQISRRRTSVVVSPSR